MVKRIVLVGCGRISGRHLQVIKASPDLELAGVCDLKPDRARQAGEAHGVPFACDALALVRSLRPDLAAVLTDSGSHARVGMALAPHVPTLIIEKPMALTLESADGLIEACAAAGTRLFVVKQNRYNPPVLKLRRALERGAFGRMVLGTVRVRWCRDQAYYDQDPWRGTWKDDGGVFTNQASHHIDLLQWMMGPVASVQACIATRLVRIEAEDTGVAILKFKSGALGVIEATTATRPRDLEGSLSILGETGSVVIGGFATNKLETWNFTNPAIQAEAEDDPSQPVPNVYGLGHAAFYRAVCEALDSGARHMLDGLEGRKSLEIISALYASAAAGREVDLRWVPRPALLGVADGY
jgi:predicted dehydrogenase